MQMEIIAEMQSNLHKIREIGVIANTCLRLSLGF